MLNKIKIEGDSSFIAFSTEITKALIVLKDRMENNMSNIVNIAEKFTDSIDGNEMSIVIPAIAAGLCYIMSKLEEDAGENKEKVKDIETLPIIIATMACQMRKAERIANNAKAS